MRTCVTSRLSLALPVVLSCVVVVGCKPGAGRQTSAQVMSGEEYIDADDTPPEAGVTHKIWLKSRLLSKIASAAGSGEAALDVFPNGQFKACSFKGSPEVIARLGRANPTESVFVLKEIAETPGAGGAAAVVTLIGKTDEGEFQIACVGKKTMDKQVLPVDSLNQALRLWADIYTINNLYPPEKWRSVYREAPTASDNFDQENVTAILSNPATCRMYARDSNSVVEKRVMESETIKFVWSSEDVLRKCEEILAVPQTRCAALEFAGHASRLSVGLNHYPQRDVIPIGVNQTDGGFQTYPSDPQMMQRLVQCFNRLLPPGAPIVFSTCGGAWKYVDPQRGYGFTAYYRGKQEASEVLAKALGRPVISALGFSFSSGVATISPAGWHRAEP